MAQQTIQIADKPTLDEVKALLENSGYGLEAIKSALGGGGIKSVQRGVVNDLNQNQGSDPLGSFFIDVTISAVDTSKTIVIAQSNITRYLSTQTYFLLPCCRLVNSTTLRLYRSGVEKIDSEAYSHYQYSWQVIEFE